MVSLYEASHGYAAKTTASRDAAGNVVGTSTGSNYVRTQDAQKQAQAQNYALKIATPEKQQAYQPAPYSTIYQQQNQQLQTQMQQVAAERPPATLQKQSIVSQAASYLGVKPQLDSANNYVSSRIPTLETIQNKRDTTLEKVGLSDERQKVTDAIRSNSVTAGIQDYYVHGFQGLKETPVSFAAEQGALLAGAAAGGYLLKGAGIAGRVGLTKIGLTGAASAVEPVINVGLGAGAVYEASKVKSVEEGTGFITEFALMGSGFKAGSKAGLKTYDKIRTFGSEKVPIENVVKNSVLEGTETFPQTTTPNPQAVLSSFKDPTTNSLIGYHATTSNMGDAPAVLGKINPSHPSDIPGLYVSPAQEGASVHFLRMGGEETNPLSTISKGVLSAGEGVLNRNTGAIKHGLTGIKTGIIGTSDPLTPNVLKITLNNVERLPEDIRYSNLLNGKLNSEPAQEFMLNAAPKGNAYLTPVLETKIKAGVNTEAEAVIVPETTLTKSPSTKYFDWEGRRVKLEEYKIQDPLTTNKDTGLTYGDYNDIDPLKTKSPSSTYKPETAGEISKSYRMEQAGSKGLISEIAYPTNYLSGSYISSYAPTIFSRANPLEDYSRNSYPNTRPWDNLPLMAPRSTYSRSLDTIVSEVRTPNTRVYDPISTISRAIDTRIIDNRVIDNRAIDNRVIDNRAIDNRIIDNRIITNRVIDNRIIDNHIIDNHVIDNHVINNHIIDNQIIDNQIQKPGKSSSDIDLPSIDPLKYSTKLKKTKPKMLTNLYGDPFK